MTEATAAQSVHKMLSERISSLEKAGDMQALDDQLDALPAPSQFHTILRDVESVKPQSSALESYSELHRTARLLQRKLKETSSVTFRLFREKEKATQDLQKERAARSRMSELCRELQRQNKLLNEENKRVVAEEQTKRQQLTDSLKHSLDDISARVEGQQAEREVLEKENKDLRDKLTDLLSRFEDVMERSKKHEEVNRIKLELAKAEHGQAVAQLRKELLEAQAKAGEVEPLREREALLEKQLSDYVEKFKSFDDTVRKSHEALTSFKKEMGKMNKTIQKQQAEINDLRTNKRKSDVALIEQTTQVQTLTAELVKLQKQRDQLELLCRTLRAEAGRKDKASVPSGALSADSSGPGPAASSAAAAAVSPAAPGGSDSSDDVSGAAAGVSK
mmetsp:Transcript_13349/g.42558  ORF Transcript_13349/g.42558 Transcript_13349/m.42558 type:complete len:390 (+) Transcript_13349:28-1197(+)